LCVCLLNRIFAVLCNQIRATEDELQAACVARKVGEFNSMEKLDYVTINALKINTSSNNFQRFLSTIAFTLDVSKTNLSVSIMQQNFSHLTTLSASYHGLKSIDEIGNETFPQLINLNFSHNAITKLMSKVFNHMNHLEEADLSDNCLTHFSFGYEVITHRNLKKLHLQNNLIKEIVFEFGSSLSFQYLDLSNNYLDMFSCYLNFDHLKLQNNKLKEVRFEGTNFATLKAQNNLISTVDLYGTFKSVNLSHNQVTDINKIGASMVGTIDLSFNKLSVVVHSDYNYYEYLNNEDSYRDDDQVWVSHKKSVESLILSHNQIENINILSNFEGAIFIDLQENILKEVDFNKIATDFPNLKKLTLNENPLDDSTIAAIKQGGQDFMVKFDYSSKVSTTTASPIITTKSSAIDQATTTTTTNKPSTTTNKPSTTTNKPLSTSAASIIETPAKTSTPSTSWIIAFLIVVSALAVIGYVALKRHRNRSNFDRFGSNNDSANLL